MGIQGHSSELQPSAEHIGAWTRLHRILDGRLLWYLFVAPAVVLIAIFMVLPIVQALSLALYRWNGIRPRQYVGLDNLVDLWSDKFFVGALQHTLVFAIVATVGTVGIGLVLAVAISRGVCRGTAVPRAVLPAGHGPHHGRRCTVGAHPRAELRAPEHRVAVGRPGRPGAPLARRHGQRVVGAHRAHDLAVLRLPHDRPSRRHGGHPPGHPRGRHPRWGDRGSAAPAHHAAAHPAGPARALRTTDDLRAEGVRPGLGHDPGRPGPKHGRAGHLPLR